MTTKKTAKNKKPYSPAFLVIGTYDEVIGEFAGETQEDALMAAIDEQAIEPEDGDEYKVLPLSSVVKLRYSRPVSVFDLKRV